jgi:hypothetical protein
MRLLPAEFAWSPSVRCSLKRGLARRAIGSAKLHDADLTALIALVRGTGRGKVALGRACRRLLVRDGVVGCRLLRHGRGLALTVRNWREIVTLVAGEPVFAEPSLLYTRIVYEAGRSVSRLRVSRASFSPHALERFVERTSLRLDLPLLPAADREASALLAAVSRDGCIEDGDDAFVPSLEPGVWAGSPDQEVPEPELAACLGSGSRLPLFSVRTFLGPGEMRPTLWLRWRRDRRMTMDA